MNFSFNITRWLFVVALVAALVAAGIAMKAQQENAAGLERASVESLFWSAAQVEIELSRFTAALGRYAIDRDSVSAADLNERFDILWSRILLFRDGEVGRRLAALDTAGVVASLFREVQAHEDAVMNIDKQSDARIARIITAFAAYHDHLRAFSIRVIRSEEDRLATVRENVRASGELTVITMITVVAIAGLIISLLLLESRRYRNEALASQSLAERAEAASRTKSRFLTMMSHELRTPMNGVMGMLALVRQTQLSEAQARLVEQAQRSGTRMVTLLGDMLDLSDLQSERQTLNQDVFSLADLAEDLERQLAPPTERAGLLARIDVSDGAPARVLGDFVRLRQAVLHLLTHMVEIVGSKDIRVAIDHDTDHLTVEIDAAVHGRDEPGWQPEAITEAQDGNYAEFASDALSPMIAKGLVELMDGRVDVVRRASDRASVVISVPFESLKDIPHEIRIEVASATQAAVLVALVRAEGWRLWSSRSAGGPSAVLVSAGDRDEQELVARLGRAHPEARLVCVGTPNHPDIFDGFCPVPVTRSALIASLGLGNASLPRVGFKA